ncbi:SGNH/GDSL hydrolase family protein [Pseudomonadota bacterium]
MRSSTKITNGGSGPKVAARSDRATNTALKTLSISIASFVLFFGLAEGLARLSYAPDQVQRDNLFEYDQEKIYRLKSNYSRRFAGKPVYTNSYGYRDAEIPVEKPPHSRRLAVIGDSVSFGHGVSGPRTYSEQLENRLNQTSEPDFHFDVINTAAPGNSAIQEYYDLARVVKFKPDLAIIQFTLNDVVEPYVVMRRFGGVGWDYHNVEDVSYFHHLLKQNSAFYLFLSDMHARLMLGEPSIVKFEKRAKRIELYDVKKLIYKSDEPRISDAWHEYLSWLDKMVDLAKANNIRVVYLVSPYSFQFRLSPESDLPQIKLRQFAETHDMVYVDLLAILRAEFLAEYASGHPQTSHSPVKWRDVLQQDPDAAEAFWYRYFIDADHYSADGHAHVAEILYPRVRQLLSMKDKEKHG